MSDGAAAASSVSLLDLPNPRNLPQAPFIVRATRADVQLLMPAAATRRRMLMRI